MELINSLSWTILSFVFVLGIMIFIHELGHYLVAKWLGIRVEVFSLGFGPRLIGFKYNETDYRVSLLPLGGYVKMLGENYDENLAGDEDEFLSRPKSHRFAVAIAGPAMNILLAVLLLAGNYMVGIPVPSYLSEEAVVQYVVPDSPAGDAGLQEGDQIVSLGGQEISSWEDLRLSEATSPGASVTVAVRRDGERLEKIVTIGEQESTGAGFLGVFPKIHTVVSGVQEESPAAKANLQSGDTILSVSSGSREADQHAAILDLIAASESEPVDFRIQRGDEVLSKSITPEEIDGQVRVGIMIAPVPDSRTTIESYGPIEAVRRSVERNAQLTWLTFQIVGKLVTGATSLKMMSGPIEIARFSGEAASQGWLALTGFMALISLQLGIFNLFPIPILDGGVIALLAIEGLIGRDLSMEIKERIFQVGFLFLLVLMGIVIFNDIAKNI